MRLPGSRATIPCTGGCGTNAVNHIPGSDIAKLCKEGSLRRSRPMRLKHGMKNQNIRVRTVANNSIDFHNTMVKWTEKLLRVHLGKSRITPLRIKGYDKQAEEFMEGNSDPMFNEARDELNESFRALAETPKLESGQPNAKAYEASEDAYEKFRELAELRYLRLVEQGRIKADFNWERMVDIYCAKMRAVHEFDAMTPQEREAARSQMEHEEDLREESTIPPPPPPPEAEDDLEFEVDPDEPEFVPLDEHEPMPDDFIPPPDDHSDASEGHPDRQGSTPEFEVSKPRFKAPPQPAYPPSRWKVTKERKPRKLKKVHKRTKAVDSPESWDDV